MAVNQTNIRNFLITVECANLIGRSPGAVRNLVMRRAIPFRKPGGRLLFIKTEILKWVDGAPGVTLEQLKESSRRTIFQEKSGQKI